MKKSNVSRRRFLTETGALASVQLAATSIPFFACRSWSEVAGPNISEPHASHQDISGRDRAQANHFGDYLQWAVSRAAPSF